MRFRYFLVGEYGDETFRPHYHAALFGFATCVRGRTKRWPGSMRSDWSNCCSICKLVGDSWGHGDVDLGMLETASASYLAGYVTKKMTMRDDYRLLGREPEFARMSLRPGLGADFMHEVASTLLQFNLDQSQADVPSALRHGNRELPLGRYLRKKLRSYIGKDVKTPQHEIEKIQEELRSVRQAAFDASRSFSSALQDENRQKALNFKTRKSIYKQRKSI